MSLHYAKMMHWDDSCAKQLGIDSYLLIAEPLA
jgi:hypothetical protein